MRTEVRASTSRHAIVILAIVMTFGVSWSATAEGRTFVAVATGTAGGGYFPMGAALAEVWSTRVAGIQAMAQTTSGSVANVQLLGRGDVTVAFVQNDTAFYAFHGIGMFIDRITNRPRPVSTLRGMAMLHPETIQLVTLKSKGISSVRDLRERRVGVGAPGSASEVNARQILRAFGLSYDAIREDFLTPAEAADQLKDGVIDAAFIIAGIPTAALADIASTRDLLLIPIPWAVVDQLRAQYPYYASVTVPANTYRGQRRAVETAAVTAMLVTRQELEARLIYELTKALWENVDRLAAAHASGKDITLSAARRGMSIPLHAGALRYYRERGIR
jgi:TRAP transporter TAXI family solute receptor